MSRQVSFSKSVKVRQSVKVRRHWYCGWNGLRQATHSSKQQQSTTSTDRLDCCDVIHAETVTKAQGPGGKPISPMLLCFFLFIGTHSFMPAAKTYNFICRYI